ncbi:MAG: (Na+)-NQR maturation NqrM [Pirellulaceae bacterium]|nr:(Na+)-NQR maturation NqrM [Pirellulaceae bacterium]
MNATIFLVAFGVSLVVFACVMIGMAVGYILNRKRLRGSCGGIANQGGVEGSSNCSLCSNTDKTCKDLASRMQSAASSDS